MPDWFEDLASELAGDVLDLPLEGAERLLVLAERLARARPATPITWSRARPPNPPCWFGCSRARDWLWLLLREPMEDDAELRFFFTFVDAGVSTVAGIVEDGVLERGFDAVNDEEWAAWLARHGAKEVTLGRTPELRAPVRACTTWPSASRRLDRRSRRGRRHGLGDLLRLVFSYRGSFMRKMQAGMGDTVFTPVYEVLRRRGVRFKFFHEVTKLGVAGHDKRVDSIEVVPQVELRDGAEEYLPLADVRGLPCWPSATLWDQLEPRLAVTTSSCDPTRSAATRCCYGAARTSTPWCSASRWARSSRSAGS